MNLSQGRKIIRALKRNLFHILKNRPNRQRKANREEKEKLIQKNSIFLDFLLYPNLSKDSLKKIQKLMG